MTNLENLATQDPAGWTVITPDDGRISHHDCTVQVDGAAVWVWDRDDSAVAVYSLANIVGVVRIEAVAVWR